MNLDEGFTVVKSCDRYALPYDFYISTYPIVMTQDHHAGISNGTAAALYRATGAAAVRFCNRWSRKNNLALAYRHDANGQIKQTVTAARLTLPAFRLPTPREWEYAARGWSESKTGAGLKIQQEHFKIPGIDYPTTAAQQEWFEHGYRKTGDLMGNHLGIVGMLAYAREWCSPLENENANGENAIKWEEYYTNYDNMIGYQTVTFRNQEPLPFRVVLPLLKTDENRSHRFVHAVAAHADKKGLIGLLRAD
jgi:hypothetical protein